jgi:hypothetical protein
MTAPLITESTPAGSFRIWRVKMKKLLIAVAGSLLAMPAHADDRDAARIAFATPASQAALENARYRYFTSKPDSEFKCGDISEARLVCLGPEYTVSAEAVPTTITPDQAMELCTVQSQFYTTETLTVELADDPSNNFKLLWCAFKFTGRKPP